MKSVRKLPLVARQIRINFIRVRSDIDARGDNGTRNSRGDYRPVLLLVARRAKGKFRRSLEESRDRFGKVWEGIHRETGLPSARVKEKGGMADARKKDGGPCLPILPSSLLLPRAFHPEPLSPPSSPLVSRSGRNSEPRQA